MSAVMEKATRRDLRRAVGAEAIGVIEEHTARLHGVERTARIALARADDADDRLRSLSGIVDRLSAESVALGDVTARLTSTVHTRSLWGRLCWLWTGR
jgi:hypothetical protein